MKFNRQLLLLAFIFFMLTMVIFMVLVLVFIISKIKCLKRFFRRPDPKTLQQLQEAMTKIDELQNELEDLKDQAKDEQEPVWNLVIWCESV